MCYMAQYTDVKEFTVKRSSWYRGKGYAGSKLLNEHGERCCLGFFAEACGISDNEILDVTSPGALVRYSNVNWSSVLVSETDDQSYNSYKSNLLMEVNDNKSTPDSEKEIKITGIFNDLGIKVTFVD